MAIGTTDHHAGGDEHVWQPELVRHCATDHGMTESVGWAAPLGLDESETENEARNVPTARGIPARIGALLGRGKPTSSDDGTVPPRGGWSPGIGYVDLG
jgi:hypothetical protein